MQQPELFPELIRAPGPAKDREPSFHSARVEAAPGFVPLAELAPAAAGPGLTGIARLAAEAPEIDFRNEVEYHDLTCRSLVARCDSPRMPFPWTINPYRGCEFACTYCYARYTHEFMELEDWIDFERKIFVKGNAREALLQDLRKHDFRGQWIAIGAATDPYQPAERRYQLTRSLLEVFAGRRNMRLSITTKSDLVTRDIDLLQRIREHSDVHVNVTVTTPHYALSRRIEPRAPRPDRRLAAVHKLTQAGVPAGVFLMPVLPRINDGLEDIDLLMRLARDAGAEYVAAQVLFLRTCSKKRFFPFIQEQFPELLPYYRRIYAGRGSEALAEYKRRKTAEIQALKRKYGLTGSRRDPDPHAFVPDQLALPEW